MKKNYKAIIMATAIATTGVLGGVTSALINPLEAHAQQTTSKTVNVSYLNVRSGADKNSSIIGVLKKGDVIEVSEVVKGWNKFSYNGQTAYVDGGFLTTGTTAPTTGSYTTGVKTVNTPYLNVRSSTSKSSAILGVLKAGEVIEVQEIVQGWSKITYNGQTGYIYGLYLKDGANSVSSATTPTNTTTSTTTYNATDTGNKTVNVSYLNVRSGANKNSSVLGVLKAGEVIEVVDVVLGWSKFNYNGQTAYVDARYLKDGGTISTSNTVNIANTTSNKYVNTPVNMREAASNNAKILRVLNIGDIVSAVGDDTSWNKVTFNGQSGYVYGKYLTLVEQEIPAMYEVPTEVPKIPETFVEATTQATTETITETTTFFVEVITETTTEATTMAEVVESIYEVADADTIEDTVIEEEDVVDIIEDVVVEEEDDDIIEETIIEEEVIIEEETNNDDDFDEEDEEPSDFDIQNGVLVSYIGLGGDVVIPSGVTKIGEDAFYLCTDVTSVVIPSGVTEIENRAFAVCKSLTSVSIPSTVTRIGEYAFSDIPALTSISIPSSVTEIQEGAFAFCDGLTSVTIPSSVTKIGGYAFGGCASLTSATIPSGATVADDAFDDEVNITLS